MKNWPLKWRLSVLVCFVLLSTIVMISIVAYIELKESLLKNIDPTLKAMTEGILSDIDEAESYEAHQAKICSITGYTGGRHSNQYRIWMDGGSEKMFASDPQDRLLVNLPIEMQPEVGEFTFFNFDDGNKYRVVWTRYQLERGIANIAVASSSYFVYHEMEEFLQLLLILGGSLVVGSFLLVPVIVGWAMQPVDKVVAILRQVTPGNMEYEPLHNLKVPQELIPFADALDGMLIRLDKVIKQQKQFIADASHELRTPLTVVKSTIQTARMAKRDATDYVKVLDDILQDIDRMERLIGHLLSLARIDEGKGLSNFSRLSLDNLLINLAETFDAKASQQGGRVICDNNIPTWVKGNKSELDQLFTNILDNAVKYGPSDGVVRITLNHESDGWAKVCIHDDGGQIPPEALPRLFDRFYRVDSSRSRATGGTGLGLAIANEIVRRHNGRIEITSNPQEGTSVFVFLPLL